ncbi:MAG: hypothetical protein AAF194_05375, partial [Pseudomonadota bacterium]
VSGEKDIIIPAKMGQQAAALNDKIHYVELAQTSHFQGFYQLPKACPRKCFRSLTNHLFSMALKRRSRLG